MKEYNLKFITEENLKKHVKDTILQYKTSMEGYNLKKFNSNLVDPIKLTFDKKIYGVGWDEIINNELYRQKDKTNGNIIGYFHQNLFKYINNCEVPSEGFDIIFNKNVYVEMKNKHNTMNSSSAQKTYTRMKNQLSVDEKATCYLVEVVTKHIGKKDWVISLDKKKVSDPKIKRVSIDYFLAEVTGEENAFYQLCEVLPTIIDEVIIDLSSNGEFTTDTVFEELQDLNPDISKVLYSLAFTNYLGFEDY